jgi:PAS domain S-box-containing protein
MLKTLRDALYFALAYLLAALVGRSLSADVGHFFVIWPPAGLYVAMLACSPVSRWPVFIAGAIGASLIFDLGLQQDAPVTACGFALARTAQAMFGAALVRICVGEPLSLHRLRHLLLWTGCAGFLAPAVGATLSALIVSGTLTGRLAPSSWFDWWSGNVVGINVFGPLAWWLIVRGRALLDAPVEERALEAGIMTALLTAGAHAVFSGALAGVQPYVLMPFFVWPALRFGVPGVSVMAVVLAAIAVSNTAQGHGPFAQPGADLATGMVLAQSFCVIHAFTFYVLAAIFEERRRAETALHESNAELERRVEVRTGELAVASANLLQQRDRYQAAVRASGHVLYDTDMETGQVLYAGACERILGYTPEELEGDRTNWRQLIHPDDLARYLEAVEATADAPMFHLVYRVRHRSGGYIVIQDDGYRISHQGNADAGRMIGFVKDITEQHRAQAALLESEQRLREMAGALRQRNDALLDADRRKDEFLATLAHELRNPLAPIRNSLEIMRLKGAEPALAQQAHDMMERQLSQLVRLIDDLLDLSRISHNRLQLRKQTVSLAEVLASAVETSRPLIDERGHELVVELPDAAVWVHADLTRLAQVFVNLLNNAAKYTEAGGRLRLFASLQGEQVAVTVEDNGIGIPDEMMPAIFDMFTQVDRSPERAQGGLGIGLTLVRRLVDLHGGRIEVRSANKRGSAFTVHLPLAAPPAAPAAPAQAVLPQGRVAPAGAYRVLVVDDNRDAAVSLATFLGLAGHDTRTAHDGRQALEVCAAYRPEVVVLDIGLPGMSGYEVAREIRARAGGEHVLLLAVTGWGQAEDRRRSSEAGFDLHLVKPVDPVELESVLIHARPAARAKARSELET